MKRRRFIQALAAAPAAPALLAQQPVSPPIAADPSLRYGSPDEVADTILHFFSAQQYAALRKLSDLLVPATSSTPGALEAHAPEFLDFFLGQSAADRQQLYRTGLDGLNAQAKKRFSKPFAEVDAAQADALLAPLRDPWNYNAPVELVSAFLRAAKDDVRRATLNSREWSLAASTGPTRGGGGGLYWLPID